MLSAQCTDIRVNQVTPDLFALADNPFDMAKVKTSEIKKLLDRVVYLQKKSKAISELSKILCNKYDGVVPESFDALEELPGVGHKTASVVMSQGFNHPAFPVDTHIRRLAQRWRLSKGKNVKQTERDLKKGFPEKIGINFTCKSFFMAESIALLELRWKRLQNMFEVNKGENHRKTNKA